MRKFIIILSKNIDLFQKVEKYFPMIFLEIIHAVIELENGPLLFQ